MILFKNLDGTCCYSKLNRPANGREVSSEIWKGIWVLSPSRSWARAVVGRQETLTPGGYHLSARATRLFLEQE